MICDEAKMRDTPHFPETGAHLFGLRLLFDAANEVRPHFLGNGECPHYSQRPSR